MHSAERYRTRRQARKLIRSRARTFYLSSLFLPATMREDIHIVYAYYRSVDDLADEPPPGWKRADILASLDQWHEGLYGTGVDPIPLLAELRGVMERYDIAPGHLAMVLDGARRDVDLGWMETMEELVEYSVLVAGSVGMVMAQILGGRGEQARAAACDLGVAMQLTNVLRDVGEDLRRSRIYLPRQELARAGCPADVFRRPEIGPGLRLVMDGIMVEARRRYRNGLEGIRYLDRPTHFAVYLAATLYARILTKIERNDYDVFTHRVHLTALEKWLLAVPAYMDHRRMLVER